MSGWEGGSTRAWRRLRARVLAANAATNGGRCTMAIPDVCTGRASTVHHVEGRMKTGDDPRWLQAACRECNLHVGEPETHPVTCSCGYGRGGAGPEPRRVSSW